MRYLNLRCMFVVFFCLLGWVCIDPAIGAEGEDEGVVDADTGQGNDADAPDLFGQGEPAKSDELPDSQSVKLGAFGKIKWLTLDELDITKVLQLLSIESKRNIVASRSVTGKISANLYDVDFYDALDAILHTNGFGYREVGDFIYVYTVEELQAIEDTEKKLAHRVVRLNYMTATDASTFVKPLLSSAGSIAVSGDVKVGFKPSVTEGGANESAHSDVLFIRDYPENIDQMVAVIKELDIRPKQVLIEATVLEVRLNEVNAYGTDLSILVDYDLGIFSSPLNVVDTIISGEVLDSEGDSTNQSFLTTFGRGQAFQTTVGGTESGEAGFKFGILHDRIAAFVRALDRVTDMTVVAKPKLLVLNRMRAQILIGAKLGYVSTESTETSTTQTIKFLEVGTQLIVRPFISNDNMIRMELQPSVSDGSTVQLGAFVIPNETTNELITNVLVRSGQTIVLSGLFKEDVTVSREQVPFLGDLPLVGAAFKGYDDSTLRTEVIFLVTATIIKDQVLAMGGDHAKDQIELARIGARQGLLPWSRNKMTATHLRNAHKFYNKGDNVMALWYTDIALSLDPTLIEARMMKEKITGPRQRYFDHSMLTRTVGLMVDEALKEQSADREASESESGATTQGADDDQSPDAEGDKKSEGRLAPAPHGASSESSTAKVTPPQAPAPAAQADTANLSTRSSGPETREAWGQVLRSIGSK